MGERPYSDEDVELVARLIHGYVLGNLPDQHCPRLARQLLGELASAGRLRPTGAERFQLGDLAATDTKVGGRIEGRVIRLADDGMVTIAVPQGALVPPMEVTAPARELARVDALEVTESLRGQLDPDTVRDLAALAGYELGRSDERAELERAGRLLPADAETLYSVRWRNGMVSNTAYSREGAIEAARRLGITSVCRMAGQWRPVSSEDTGEATDAHQP